jgi:hypothetical protein
VSSVPYTDLEGADLVVDRLYKGGAAKNGSDDPISKLVSGAGVQGGFRRVGKIGKDSLRLVVLYTTGNEPAWPDTLDANSGIFTYYGDNRSPGKDLHTPPGNRILRDTFGWACSEEERHKVPPFLVFEKGGAGRDVVFRGIAVPGAVGLPPGEELVALWRYTAAGRFQNYRALLTILADPVVSGEWLRRARKGDLHNDHCPQYWREWVATGRITPLLALRVGLRTKAEQLPRTDSDEKLLSKLSQHFQENPYAFEKCAVELWRILAPNTGEVNLTRPWRDGGRDAVGKYLFGPMDDRLPVEFALEAKCYSRDSGVGVRDMSRLISRLQHRQFGVFVTTSYFAAQTYKEVRDDGHPVVLIAGADIIQALRRYGVQDVADLDNWLRKFPSTSA